MIKSKVQRLTILGKSYVGYGHEQNGYFSWLKFLAIENLDFGRGHARNFDHLTMVILKLWPLLQFESIQFWKVSGFITGDNVNDTSLCYASDSSVDELTLLHWR